MKRRLVLSTVLFLLGLVLLDRGVGFVLNLALSRVKTGQTIGLINRALHHKDAGVLVFGSSRAMHHVDPRLLGRELGVSAYNAGCDGQGILYARMLEALLFRRGTASKLFVLHVEPKDLYRQDASRVAMFAPYLGEERVVDDILESTGPLARLKLMSWTYRYNSLLLPLIRNLVAPHEEGFDGYVPLRGVLDDLPAKGEGLDEDLDEDRRRVPIIQEELVARYREFIRSAKEGSVSVVLASSPRFGRRGAGSTEIRPGIVRFMRLAEAEGVPFIRVDEQSYPIFHDSRLFRDWSHLNAEGSALYSEILAREIRSRLPGLFGSDQPRPPE